MRSLVIGIGLLFSCHAWAQATKVGPGIQVVPRATAPGKDAPNSAYWTNSADANKPYYTTPASADSPLMTPSYTSSVADGAGAVAVSVDTSTTWTNPVAHLLKLANNTIEKFAVYAASGLIESSWARNISTAQTAGLSLANTTAAAAGAQQFSPAVKLCGNGWKTNATAASQETCSYVQNRSVQGAASPSSEAVVFGSVNGGSANEIAAFSTEPTKAFTVSNSSNGAQLGRIADLIGFGALYLGTAVDNDFIASGNGFGNIYFAPSGTIRYDMTPTMFGPNVDLSYANGGAGNAWAYTYTGHLVGGSPIPLCTPGTGAGTGGACSLLTGSDDLSGTVEIAAGTGPAATATVATVTFSIAYSATPRCSITPSNANAQGIITTSPFVNQASGSTTTFVLTSGAAGITASTTFDYNYNCIQ